MSIADDRISPQRILLAGTGAAQDVRVARLLEADGYQVTGVANGRLALQEAQREPPALVVAQAALPELDGIALCRALRADPALRDVAVILVVAPAAREDVVRGLECRVDNFLFEPYEPERLRERVQSVLVNARDRRAELEDRVRARTRELQQANDALRQSQGALVQQERLRALGQMASGIAHDINNAVSPIALYTEALLEREPALSERARGYLTTIQRALDDVAQTVGRLREFYRPREQEPQLADVELNPLVQQVVDLTRARWNDLAQQRGILIDVRTELASDLATIRGAENEIRNALTHVVINAIDALPAGGTIRIGTRMSQQRSAHGQDEPVALLEIADTGVGMDEETRRRCLEPFFTTKGERGSGLGLAMVYGMARRHGVGLDVDSVPGAGTTVRLAFRSGTPPTGTTGRFAQPLFSMRSLRVLVIDDDPALLESLRSALHDEGHKVTAASGGQQGLTAFRDAQKAGMLFDVVITDLGMPFVDGKQVIAGVRAMSPGTPIILLTGWGQHVAAEGETPPQVDRLLGKPPRIRELRSALAELTGRRSTDRLG